MNRHRITDLIIVYNTILGAVYDFDSKSSI